MVLVVDALARPPKISTDTVYGIDCDPGQLDWWCTSSVQLAGRLTWQNSPPTSPHHTTPQHMRAKQLAATATPLQSHKRCHKRCPATTVVHHTTKTTQPSIALSKHHGGRLTTLCNSAKGGNRWCKHQHGAMMPQNTHHDCTAKSTSLPILPCCLQGRSGQCSVARTHHTPHCVGGLLLQG